MKKCKGTGKAKGFEGCGLEVEPKRYGLCLQGNRCFQTWATSTPEGLEYIDKISIKSKAIVKTITKQKKQESKVKILSADGYRKAYIQPKINEIARLIDFGQPCIATGATKGKMNGGHRISTGSNRTLTYNLHNIFMQSVHSNQFKGGDDRRFDQGIIKTYGKEYFTFLESLRQCPPIKLNKPFLVGLNKVLIEAKKSIELVERTPDERIQERNRINEMLGIYSLEFSQFFK